MAVAVYVSLVALWVLVIVQGLVLLGMVRIVHRLQQEGNGPDQGQIGRKVPTFAATDLMGQAVDSGSLAGRLRALLFVSPNCRACTASLDEMELLRNKAEGNVLVICRTSRDECARLVSQHRLAEPVVADGDERIARLFDIAAFPTAVLINEDDRIQSYGEPLREGDQESPVGRVSSAQAAGVS